MQVAAMNHVTEIHSNFPISLMIGLRNRFGLQRFIETGTCWGGTASMAAMAFPMVDTVEIMAERYSNALMRFAEIPHVHCHLADSREFLRTFDWAQLSPSLIYLDAHCPDGEPDPEWKDGYATPLWDEFQIIGSLYRKHCIVVDDTPVAGTKQFVVGWDCFMFGTEQFSVLTPDSCNWELWIPACMIGPS
jgi:hypothetical protein